MTVTGDTRPSPSVVLAEPQETTPARNQKSPLAVVVLLAGVALAYVVGRDGSMGWQLVRIAVTAGLAISLIGCLRRWRGPARAAALIAAGLPLSATGLGIGGPHLAKAGWSPVTVAGLVVLASGLFLAVSGAAGVLRPASRWRRVVISPALLVAALVVLFALGQAIAATNVPRTAVGTETPGDRGLRYDDVEFSAADGVVLSGWYIPSTNGAAVVVAHGAGSTRSAVLDQAVVLARHGFGVLLYDARGHGRSEGRAMDFGWYGDDDLRGAVSFVQAQPDVDADRIAALGLSMGRRGGDRCRSLR